MSNRQKPNLGDEIRRLQRTVALLRCMQIAAAEKANVDWDDALQVICALMEQSLTGLDRLELTIDAS